MSLIQNAQTSSGSHRELAVNLFLLLLSVYVLTSSGNTVDVTDDGILRFTVTESIVERGSFELTEEVGKLWGIRGVGGRYFTNHGIGQSLLAVPFYCIGKPLGRPKFLVSALGPIISALVCVLIFHFSLRVGYAPRTAVAVSLLAGLCTQLWPESKSPFNHNTEALFSLLSVLLAYTYTQGGGKMTLLLAGASLGFALLTRVTTLFWLLPLGLLLLPCSDLSQSPFKKIQTLVRNGILLLAGFLPFLVFCLWYNDLRFGSILESGYSLWAKERNFANFGNPLWVGLAGELVSPGKGVFWYCPVLLLVPLGVKSFLQRQQRAGIVFGLATFIFLFFFASYAAWHGDNAWGPRYLTFLMPYWIIVVGAFIERRGTRKLRDWGVVTNILVVLSFLVQLGAVMVDKNLHYNRLFKAGVIKDAATYAYPRKLYFDPKYSGLVNRPGEVLQAFAFTTHQFFANSNAGAPEDEELQSLDFWWANRLSRGMKPTVVLMLVGPIVFYIFILSQRIRRLLVQC